MGTRRVLKWTRRQGALPLLELVEEALPAVDDNAVVVQVAFAILDVEPLVASSLAADGEAGFVPDAAFAGSVRRGGAGVGLEVGSLVVGVGPLADIAVAPASGVWAWPPQQRVAAREAASLPWIRATSDALADLGLALGDRVVVSGRGLTARLAAQQVEAATGLPPQTVVPEQIEPRRLEGQDPARGPGEFDALVDTSADPGRWPQALSLLRRNGRVLLLIPPGSQTHSFDFYPKVHRGSLTLLARRVPAMTWPMPALLEGTLPSGRLLDGQMTPASLLREIAVEAAATAPPIPLDAPEAGMALGFRFEPKTVR